jgi:chromosome segregation ATPase
MAELQATVDSLSIKVESTHAISGELNELQRRYQEQDASLRRAVASEEEARLEGEEARAMIDILNMKLESERQIYAVIKMDLEDERNKNQKLQSERNSFKQKADSLSKEISRLCKNGRNLEDIRRIVNDEESRITEVEILKAQKKRALDDLTEYRIAYQQSLVTQLRCPGMDGAAMKAMEKISALERVISELTEYVNAKEMQLETMIQVNQALAEEVTSLAKANMHKNDI